MFHGCSFSRKLFPYFWIDKVDLLEDCLAELSLAPRKIWNLYGSTASILVRIGSRTLVDFMSNSNVHQHSIGFRTNADFYTS